MIALSTIFLEENILFGGFIVETKEWSDPAFIDTCFNIAGSKEPPYCILPGFDFFIIQSQIGKENL